MKLSVRSLTAILILVILLAGCSTTRRLGPDETLYTGVKELKVEPKSEKISSSLRSELTEAINVKPNNPMPFMSPYRRTPFPIGLWVYNNWSDSAKGLKGALYRWLVRQPVLVSDVKPAVRTKMMEQVMRNNGYLDSRASWSLVPEKNPKKARISYSVDLGKPWPIDSVILFRRDSFRITRFIDSLILRSDYPCKGQIFNTDSLEALRVRIANRMRNRGYYYFKPEYIRFLADTFMTPGSVVLKVSLEDNLPHMALIPYRTGDIVTRVERRSRRNPGVPDTLLTPRGELVVMRPQRLRPNMIPSCITFREGKLFSVRDMDRTQTRLSRLGIFQSIDIQPVPADTSHTNPVMDVFITCRLDRPITASVELNASSKSNSYIGPGLEFNLTHGNLFGGAEKLNIKLGGSYEWQTGRDRSSVFNSYQVDLAATLAFPRLLAPGFVKRIKRDINWTNFTLSASVMNRPHYFMLAEYGMGMTWEWKPSRNVLNQLTPFKLSYNKLIRTTHEFDSIMSRNPSIAQSFESRFIPQLSYVYTLDRFLERTRDNGITFTAELTEAGNLFAGIYELCGVHGRKQLFGTPFSQFVKGQLSLVYLRRLVPRQEQWLATRLLIGAEHAYGNSREVPYSEQFYVGGANSIRAFTVRSLGPGSYRAPRDQVNGYFDQTGTFKLEMNAEYRFPIVGILHGAVFLDAGNVWLLKKDPYRPGGELKASRFLRDIALGTGVGLRVDVGMMVVRGDLGYGLHAPYDTGVSGYFNIRFRNAFAFHLAIGYPF